VRKELVYGKISKRTKVRRFEWIGLVRHKNSGRAKDLREAKDARTMFIVPSPQANFKDKIFLVGNNCDTMDFGNVCYVLDKYCKRILNLDS